MAEQIKRGRAPPESHIIVHRLMRGEPSPLQTAKEANLYHELDEEAAHRVSTCPYIRFHLVDDSTVTRLVRPARLKQKVDGTW